MLMKMYECTGDICYYAYKEVNLLKEFLPLILLMICFALIIIFINVRYNWLEKHKQK